MAHTYYHARTNVRMFGGTISDYLPLHDWMDATKEHYSDFRHRAMRHHSLGIFEAERIFGSVIKNSDGKDVPVRLCMESHILEDLGFIPTLSDWLSCIKPKPWMARATPIRMAHGTRNDPESPSALTPQTTSGDHDTSVQEIIQNLSKIADLHLASLIMDEQDRCEEQCVSQGLPADDSNDDGQPIVYPENAAEEIDTARSLIHEALDQLLEWQVQGASS